MNTSDPASVLWQATAPPAPPTPALEGEREADVCVVGGGFTGLSAALHLAEAGARVVLLEAEDPGFGASGRNHGQVVPMLSRYGPEETVARFGPEEGERFNRFVAEAARLVFDLIDRLGIDCDAHPVGWLLPVDSPARDGMVRARAEAWASRGMPVRYLEREETEAMTGSRYWQGALHPRLGRQHPAARLCAGPGQGGHRCRCSDPCPLARYGSLAVRRPLARRDAGRRGDGGAGRAGDQRLYRRALAGAQARGRAVPALPRRHGPAGRQCAPADPAGRRERLGQPHAPLGLPLGPGGPHGDGRRHRAALARARPHGSRCAAASAGRLPGARRGGIRVRLGRQGRDDRGPAAARHGARARRLDGARL